MKLHKITNNCMNECECGSECEIECWSEYAAAFTCSPRLSRSVVSAEIKSAAESLFKCAARRFMATKLRWLFERFMA